MQLIIATPGVDIGSIRSRTAGLDDYGLCIFDTATRCGSLTVDPQTATQVTIVIRPCAVSVHAAERILDSFTHPEPPCTAVVTHCSAVPPWLIDRLSCPVLARGLPEPNSHVRR